MRWHTVAQPELGRFTGEIAAVPVTLLSRDEDAHHGPSLHPHSRQTRTHGAATRRTFPSKMVPRASAPPVRLPDHATRPLLASPTETIRLSATVVSTPRGLSDTRPPSSARVLTPRTEDPRESTHEQAHASKFLVCAGRAMSSESPRSNNDDERTGGLVPHASAVQSHSNNATDAPAPTTAVPSTHQSDTPRAASRALQRSDSELELIISELREKIALQQRSQSPMAADDEPASRNNHSRKHLKNPVEKMSLSSSGSATSVHLRRQASASQVHATRLVREGSATMVTPVVLANSASRAALTATNGQRGDTTLTPSGSDASESHDAKTTSLPHHVEPAEGFRIRAYLTGNDTAPHPVFTSSTSLGQHVPTELPSPPRITAAASPTNLENATIHASLLRPAKPRTRTLQDLELELDRLHGADGDGGEVSPVGPWAMDQDASGPLASSRSTVSLSTDTSVSELELGCLPASAAELSPRSRLLWLSDCCSDDAWATPSIRVMAMLRPGSCDQRDLLARRPVSAAQLRRRHSKSKSAPGKSRAASASTHASIHRRSSGESSATQDTVSKQPVAKTPVRSAQRPRSGSGSSSSNSSSTPSGRVVGLAQRASFRA